VALLGSIGWRLSGGSLFTIATPSMCPDLCVGTLVLDRPLAGPVQVGQVVTFHPPGTSTVFTHRVVKVLADGSFKTAGDALGTTDPWTVPRSNVIGRVVDHVRGLGWLWRCLPWMAAALACILVARRSMPNRIRQPLDLLFATMLVVVPVLVMRPLLRASVVSWHRIRGGTIVMTVVNDGLLPAQFRVTVGPTVSHVAPGHLVTLVGSPPASGSVTVGQAASFYGWEWAVVVVLVLLPMIACLAAYLWGHLRPPGYGLAPFVAPPAYRPAMARPAWPAPPGHAVAPAPPVNPATVSARGPGTFSP
jgi:signal peptidase I